MSVLRFLVIFLGILAVLRWISNKLFPPAASTSRSTRGRQGSTSKTLSGRTVKDPQCGMYVASTLAVKLRSDGKDYHFCSERCRDEFRLHRSRSGSWTGAADAEKRA